MFSPSVYFLVFILAERFTSLAHKDLSLLEYAVEFSQLAVLTVFDDAALNSLFLIRANDYRPVDLPDTTGPSWRESIIWCLESIYLQSRTQPDPVPSPPSPYCAEHKPTAQDCDRAEDRHGTRTSQIVKDQVRVPATTPAMREKAADSESAERSSSPCTVADGELIMYLGRCISEGERAPFPESGPEKAPVFTSSSERAPVPPSSPESPETHQCPLSCPLLPPPPLSSGSSSARPQPTIYTV